MNAGTAEQRDHFWDAARAFLMILGIPYHVALAYRPGQNWIVVSGEGVSFFSSLADFIHLFRMPAFFLIAGYFAALLLSRRAPDDWLIGRFKKLFVPLVAAMVLLVPPMNLVTELSNLPTGQALASWQHNSAMSGGYWVRHLWFIIILLYCSMAAAGVAARWPELRSGTFSRKGDGWMARHFVITLLAVAVVMGLWQAGAVELFYAAGLATNLPQQVMRLDELIMFAPWFLLGCLIQRAPATLGRIMRPSWIIASVALVATCASLSLDHLSPWSARFVATIAGVALTQMVIASARTFLNRPLALVQRLVAASFVIYLFHMPIIIALVWLGQYVAVPVALKAVAIMLLALGLSYGVWLVVDRSPILAFLFDGRFGMKRDRLTPPLRSRTA